MANFSLGRAANYAPGDSTPQSFNWVFAGGEGDLGLVGPGTATPTVLTIPSGVWVPVGNTIALDVSTTTATDLLVV